MKIAGYFFVALLCLLSCAVGICAAEPKAVITLSGTVEQIVIDGDVSGYQYVLATESGKRYQLIASESLDKYSRQQVTVSGLFSADSKLIVTEKIKVEKTVNAAVSAPTFGSRKVLVLLVNFPDLQGQPLTTDEARAKVFTEPNSANEHFRAASFNNYNLTGIQRADGDAFGWITISVENPNCQQATTEWTSLSNAAAQNMGINVTDYNSVVYVFTRGMCNGIAAMATLGQVGNPNPRERAWFSAGTFGNPGILVHELGHNLGLQHAKGMLCTGTNIPADCSVSEYGDAFDPMGGNQLFFFNNYYRAALGWSIGRTRTVTTSGDYILSASSLPTKGYNTLQIPLKDAAGQLTDYDYVLEFRRPYSFDNQLQNPNFETVYSGVSIRRVLRSNFGYSSQLIDTRPDTFFVADAPLSVGRTFVDATSGVTVTTLNTSPIQGARVRIQISR